MSPSGQNVRIAAVHNVKSRMLGLDSRDQNDVLDHPFLEQGVAERLEQAAKIASGKYGVELVILDALRAPRLDGPHAGQKDFRLPVRDDWVASETEILSHRTGGAVDVALMKDGDFLPMGSFYGSKEFEENPVAETTKNRKLLQTIMERAGFVGAEGNNWWHYEYGTSAWAEKIGNAAYLTEARSPERVQAPPNTVPIAPAFLTSDDRSAVIGGTAPGYFYARHSHPTKENLAVYYQDLLVVENVGLVQSGLAANMLALKGLVPKGGTIIFDSKIYYEVHRGILATVADLDWKAEKCDMTDLADLEKVLAANVGTSVVYADSPSNWFVEVLDIEAISRLAHDHGAKLIVDTSLQPLQNARAKGADIEVFSLGKYFSNGNELGGAYVSDKRDLIDKINLRAGYGGHVLALSAADIMLQQSLSLKDRLEAVSESAEKVATFLAGHPDIERVNCPDRRKLNGLCGGQISFLLKDATQGHRLEKVISSNTLSGSFPLNLAGTFGAEITTIEHFASNERHREGISREKTNEVEIPANMVRLGIGLENVNEIIDALNFALNMSSALQPMPGISRARRMMQLDRGKPVASEVVAALR